MTNYVPSCELVDQAEKGNIQAASRLISRAEAGIAEVKPALAEIYRKAGKAHVIGLTGVPGSGKSTLVASLTALFRKQGMRVAIIAVDPSSPYSGGSILGDRIRMADVCNDAGVFIRSMATRGEVGGLAKSTLDAVDILDVAGFELIIVETVGVGQDEVEIAKASHTTVVVSAPGLGDEIQAIKAGMLEIADIHVVSKCDRSDANRTLTDIKQMLTLGAGIRPTPDWQIAVVGVSCLSGEGLDILVKTITEHRKFAFNAVRGKDRLAAIASFRLQKTAESILAERFAQVAAQSRLAFAERLLRREDDPYSLANELVTAFVERRKQV